LGFDKSATAVVILNPQNDFLSEQGVTWGLVGDSAVENNTIENIARLMKAAKANGVGVFVSPH
jgi:nicotinamidase-related amidase